jgi:hypothetical protein
VNRGLARATFAVQHLVVLGILAQAALAGLFLYEDPRLLAVHNTVGSVLLVVALAVVLLGTPARFPAGLRLGLLARLQLLLLVLQYFLGILGRGGNAWAVLHFPNAFLASAVAVLWLVRARAALRGEPSPAGAPVPSGFALPPSPRAGTPAAPPGGPST